MMSAKADLVLVDSDLELINIDIICRLPRWLMSGSYMLSWSTCAHFLNNDDSLLQKYMEFSSF